MLDSDDNAYVTGQHRDAQHSKETGISTVSSVHDTKPNKCCWAPNSRSRKAFGPLAKSLGYNEPGFSAQLCTQLDSYVTVARSVNLKPQFCHL